MGDRPAIRSQAGGRIVGPGFQATTQRSSTSPRGRDHAVSSAAESRSRVTHFYRAAVSPLGPDGLRRHAETHQELLDVVASGDLLAAEEAILDVIIPAKKAPSAKETPNSSAAA